MKQKPTKLKFLGNFRSLRSLKEKQARKNFSHKKLGFIRKSRK